MKDSTLMARPKRVATASAGRVDERIGRHYGALGNPYAVPETKPRWRGRLHSWAFVASVPLGVILVALVARSDVGRAGALVFALSLSGLYAASAMHHRFLGTALGRSWMRWLDHAMIFVLIAGTYTPLCLLALPRRWGIPMLVGAWTVALGGIVIKFTSLKRFRRTSGFLYIAMGWAAVVVIPQLAHRMSATALALMAAGGALYTGGAIVLFRRRPDPVPEVFGYHELWHACVVGAGVCHFAMIALTVHRA